MQSVFFLAAYIDYSSFFMYIWAKSRTIEVSLAVIVFLQLRKLKGKQKWQD